jgi:acetoin utilization deacetylase AcuC-like enzyme
MSSPPEVSKGNTMADKLPLIYTDKHILHDPPSEYLHHRTIPYWESPSRVKIIHDHLLEKGMVEVVAPHEMISFEELAETHDAEMLDTLRHVSNHLEEYLANSPERLVGVPYFYPYTFPIRESMFRQRDSHLARLGSYSFDVSAPMGAGTWEAAYYAASVAVSGAELLTSGNIPGVYALSRPPGHHAGRDYIGGYCYLNNAALATKRLGKHGKVALINIDYHHGNGSQEIFWDDPHVLFASIHADPSLEYPFYAGYADETGGPHAPDKTVNMPLPLGSDGSVFKHALQQVLERVQQFRAEALVISLGFDTYQGDPTCRFEVTLENYVEVGQMLRAVNLPVLFVQEGGYHAAHNGMIAEALFSGFLNPV